jgi:23S rRNA pseudouridine1911/1915/1917 synthase
MQIVPIYEDNHILAVNKPSGALAQGDKTGDRPLVEFAKDYLKKKYNKPGEVFLGIPHRLDRPTSGVLLFARTSKALARLNEMFRNKEIRKTYWAVVKNCPEKDSDTLVHYMLKDEKKNKSVARLKTFAHATEAVLNYNLIAKSTTYFLLEVNPITGRHHQIRAQLSAIGCPIKGDTKYGFDRPNKDRSIHLHARKVEFIHPVSKKDITIEAPTPKDTVWNGMTQ